MTATTSLIVAPSHSILGQVVTFTAVVIGGATSTPTGAVTFLVDGQVQPPVNLRAVNCEARATFSLSSLCVGSHSIAASYGGDPLFTPPSDGGGANAGRSAARDNHPRSRRRPGDGGGRVRGARLFASQATGPFTATVDYGDDTGLRPLFLNADRSFVLSHTFTRSGLFTITVVVTDPIQVTSIQAIVVPVTVPAVPPRLRDSVPGATRS